jgi:ubiquinone/menaquinone biosynthesis C-methylase UbiE
MEMNLRLKFLVNSPLWDLLLGVFLLPPLLKAVEPRRPKKILEIGCGRGDTTRLLLRRFPEAAVTAVDYDAGQIALAGRRVTDRRVTFLQADAGRLPFDNGSFDSVFEFNSLHHIVHWQQVLAEIGRVLAPGGMFAAMDETAAFFNPLFRWFDQPESLFTEAGFLRRAAATGLNQVAGVGSAAIIKFVFEKKMTA